MHFEGLLKYAGEDKKAELRELVELKKTVGEKYLHTRDERLHEWIVDLFAKIESGKNELGVNRTDMTLLDEFFLKMLYEKADN